MNAQNRNLVIRVASSLALLPAVLLLLWIGPRATACLAAAVAGIGAYELYHIAFKRFEPVQLLGILGSAAVPLAAGFLLPGRFLFYTVWGFALLVAAMLVVHLFRGPQAQALERTGILTLGVLYPGFFLTPVVELRRMGGLSGFWWVIFLLALTWMNDTGAYFTGRAFGKHKLYPAISPSKTWEGFFGGMASSVLASFVVRALFLKQLQVSDALLLGLIVSVVAPLGDLCESMIKRAHGVKDSGALIPGHGGVLDRIDALLFAAPAVFLYSRLVM